MTSDRDREHAVRRRLAYRDRYVWRLTQAVTDTPCYQLTDRDKTRIFSAVMVGAELVYPLTSHEVVWNLWKLLDCKPSKEKRLETRSPGARCISSRHGSVCLTNDGFLVRAKNGAIVDIHSGDCED